MSTRFRITASSLNLRQGPSLYAPPLASFPRDTFVDGADLSPDGTWRRVRVPDGRDGWMSDGFLAPASLGTLDDAPWMAIAEAELSAGVREIPGPEDNPRILEYQRATALGATDDETPWCSAFVNWCMMQAGIARTNSAAARSWLTWGTSLAAPRLGCVTVLSRSTDPTKGHVGFFVDDDGPEYLRLLGGNQGNAVSIRTYRAELALGYRWRD
jgi:uncharacterized protein (TIGR02594 family)